MNPVARTHPHTVNELHRAANQICDGWGRLQFENPPDSMVATSWGGSRSRCSGPADPTGQAVLRRTRARAWETMIRVVVLSVTRAVNITVTVWEIEPVRRVLHCAIDDLVADWAIDDLIDLDPDSPNYRRDVFGLERLADSLARWFPPQPTGGAVVHPSDVVEDCGLCGQPTSSGRDTQGRLLTRRIDGVGYHTVASYTHGACYWAVWRQRRGRVAA